MNMYYASVSRSFRSSAVRVSSGQTGRADARSTFIQRRCMSFSEPYKQTTQLRQRIYTSKHTRGTGSINRFSNLGLRLSRARGLSSTTAVASHGHDRSSRVIVRNQKHGDDDAVVRISINNSRRLNSLDSITIRELTEAFEIASKNEHVRCVIFSGELDPSRSKSPSFCAGASLHEMSDLHNSTEAKNFISRLFTLCKSISDCPVPVIAAIHGHCYGAGLELAACCDMRYATQMSQFAMPEVKVGIPSVIQARLLVDIMGWARARYLMLFGKTITADEAYQQGLVNRVFSTQESMDAGIEDDIGALLECGPAAVRSQKELMGLWKSMDVNAGIQAGINAFGKMYEDGGKEPKEYMEKVLDHLRSKR